MEIRRIFYGCLEDGSPDFRYREVIRNEEGTVVKYKAIDEIPKEALEKARELPPLTRKFVE